MKKKKNIVIIIMIIIWIILILIFSKEYIQSNKEEIPQYMILNGKYFWQYQNSDWVDLFETKELESINWKKFDIFVDNNYYNTYNYVINKNYESYLFDDNEQTQEVPDTYTLINENSFLSLVKYSEVELTSKDNEIILKFLNKNNFHDKDYSVAKKYIINEDEFIYIVTNYEENLIEEDIYYTTFYRRNNKNYMISKSKNPYNYDLYSIIDINRKFKNIILKFQCYHTYCYDMYQYTDNGYEKVIGANIE